MQLVLRQAIGNLREQLEQLHILKPYSFVLIDEDREVVADLFLVDDDTLFFDGELMKGLDEELSAFLDHLLKE